MENDLKGSKMNTKNRLKKLEREIVEPNEMFETCLAVSRSWIEDVREWCKTERVPMLTPVECYREIARLPIDRESVNGIMKRLGLGGDYK